MKKLIYILFLILFWNCSSQNIVNDNFRGKIDSLLISNQPRPFNGVVLISKDGKKVYEKAVEFSDYDSKIKLKNSTQFSTMSIAKQITATMIMREVEKGKIDLNSPIKKYLPNVNYQWTDKIKVHHLLNNTSGLNAFKLSENLLFEPGTDFKYSNIGYALLGKILENVTGKSYEANVTELFSAIGMNNSFYPNTANSKKLVNSYILTEQNQIRKIEKFPFDSELFPGSHLITTAEDLSKWNSALHNGRLIKNDSYQKMINYSTTNQHQLFSEEKIGYGYGLRINDKTKKFEIGHTGFSPAAGFTAVNLYYPKNKISVIVLENIAAENFDIAYYYESEVRKIILNSSLLK